MLHEVLATKASLKKGDLKSFEQCVVTVIDTLISVFMKMSDIEQRIDNEKIVVSVAEAVIYLRYLNDEGILKGFIKDKYDEMDELMGICMCSTLPQYVTLKKLFSH